MSTKFDDITIHREFRRTVLRDLRALPGWPAYRKAKGWPSNRLTVANLRQASEDLGYRLDVEHFISTPPGRRARSSPPRINMPVTPSRLAELLGVSREIVYRRMREGRIKGTKLVGGIVIMPGEVERVLSSAQRVQTLRGTEILFVEAQP